MGLTACDSVTSVQSMSSTQLPTVGYTVCYLSGEPFFADDPDDAYPDLTALVGDLEDMAIPEDAELALVEVPLTCEGTPCWSSAMIVDTWRPAAG